MTTYGDHVTYDHHYRRVVLGRHYNKPIWPRGQRGRYAESHAYWHWTEIPGEFHPASTGRPEHGGPWDAVRYLRMPTPEARHGIVAGPVVRFEGDVGYDWNEGVGHAWRPTTTLHLIEVMYRSASGRAWMDLTDPDDLIEVPS